MKRFLACVRKTVAGLAFSALLIGAAHAASTPNSVIFPQTPNRGIVQFLQGTDAAGTYKTLYTAGANGSKCWGMRMNNNDASATHLVTVQIVNGGVSYGGVALTSVSSAGYANAAPPQALMTAAVWPGLGVDKDGNPYFLLVSGDTLKATFATALTATDWINVQIDCADY